MLQPTYLLPTYLLPTTVVGIHLPAPVQADCPDHSTDLEIDASIELFAPPLHRLHML